MSYFDLKDQLDKILYRIFNFMQQIIFFFSFRTRKKLKKNKQYENLHENERCFILGNGPSINDLSIEQHSKLNNEIIFCVNEFYKSDIIKPTYYAIFDNVYFGEDRDIFRKVGTKFPDTTFITTLAGDKIIKEENLSNNYITVYSKLYPINKMNYNFSRNTHICLNVVSNSILMALYMGFKDIYLLGTDYNAFAHPTEHHFYEEDNHKPLRKGRLGMLLKFYAMTTEFHYLISKEANRKGANIFNLVQNSLLDAYRKADIKDILGS